MGPPRFPNTVPNIGFPQIVYYNEESLAFTRKFICFHITLLNPIAKCIYWINTTSSSSCSIQIKTCTVTVTLMCLPWRFSPMLQWKMQWFTWKVGVMTSAETKGSPQGLHWALQKPWIANYPTLQFPMSVAIRQHAVRGLMRARPMTISRIHTSTSKCYSRVYRQMSTT